MDLWKERADSNDYGARSKKKSVEGVGKVKQIKKNVGYVPAGLTAAQYNSVRNKDQAKKDANYARNVAKAGVFEDYTDFYKRRGTDVNGSWLKSVTNGHRMVKTKYDWGGDGNSNLADMKVGEFSQGKTKKTFGKKK